MFKMNRQERLPPISININIGIIVGLIMVGIASYHFGGFNGMLLGLGIGWIFASKRF